MEKSTLSEGIFCHLRTDDKRFYYMTSDNVFSDWLTPLVTLFDKTLQSPRKKSREVNIIFQSFSRHFKIGMVFPNYLKSSNQSSSG